MDYIQTAHEAATEAGVNAAQSFADHHFDGGDGSMCGFAWVTFYPENKGNTRLGKIERKVIESIGFRKDWTGKTWQLWNPSNWGGQSVDVKFAGAQAYSVKFKELTGLSVSAAERLD